MSEAVSFQGKECNLIHYFTAIQARKSVKDEDMKEIMPVEFQQTFVLVLQYKVKLSL
jgi:hypothetical protein